MKVHQYPVEYFVIPDHLISECLGQSQRIDVFMFQQWNDVCFQNVRLTLELENDLLSIDLQPDLANLNRCQAFEDFQHRFDGYFAVVFLEPIVRSLPEADEVLRTEVGHHVGGVD